MPQAQAPHAGNDVTAQASTAGRDASLPRHVAIIRNRSSASGRRQFSLDRQ